MSEDAKLLYFKALYERKCVDTDVVCLHVFAGEKKDMQRFYFLPLQTLREAFKMDEFMTLCGYDRKDVEIEEPYAKLQELLDECEMYWNPSDYRIKHAGCTLVDIFSLPGDL